MYLETFATDSESTSRVFNFTQEELRKTSLNTLCQTVQNMQIKLNFLRINNY